MLHILLGISDVGVWHEVKTDERVAASTGISLVGARKRRCTIETLDSADLNL